MSNRDRDKTTGEYKGLYAQSTDNEEEDYPPQFTTLATELEKSKWSHIDDLDDFFTRVYLYHQNHGMPSVIFMEFLSLFQTLFLACFSVFMLECIDYTTLFQNQKVINSDPDKQNQTTGTVKKKTLHDVIYPFGVCVNKIDLTLWLVLSVVIIFWLFRLVKAIYNIARYAEIRSFYKTELEIQTKDLQNITWNEVQERLLLAQKKRHMCVHKLELTELDIYNRILRFKNYKVAMVNQGLLPPKIDLPFVGQQLIFLTNGFMYNFDFLFFRGPIAPFRNRYQLKPEYKVFSKRSDLTADISRWILFLGLLNLILSPAIFVWQLLQFIYSYTELLKRDPSVLGSRRWSNYGRLYFSHFNELDHELDARLSRAYRPSCLYLNSFVSKFLVLIAKFVAFTSGAVFASLVLLTLYDEDVLQVEHVLTIISLSGACAGVARSLVPDESTVYFTDQMMYQILAHVHYMPDAWTLHANSQLVRDEFVKLFQYKFVFLLEELLSPIITPFLLLFWLRPRASRVVDFLRNFTVEVVGVGDVCSFAQMDTRRHGNPRWLSRTQARKPYQARNGKTELSLIHFAHTNPNWKMPNEAVAFMDQLRDHAVKESMTATTSLSGFASANVPSSSATIPEEQQAPSDSLNKSLYHLQSLVYNTNMQPSNLMKSSNHPAMQQTGGGMPTPTYDVHGNLAQQQQSTFGQMPRGAVSRIEGPLFANKNERQTLLTIAQASTLQISSQGLVPIPTSTLATAHENSLDMCFSALYMHELHRKYQRGGGGEYIDLDNVKEEDSNGNGGADEENGFETEEDTVGQTYGRGSKQPLLANSSRVNFLNNNANNDDDEDFERSVNDDSNRTITDSGKLKLTHTIKM